MQQTKTAPEAKHKPRRRRSPIERALVWGVILALYLVVVFEWRAQYGYNQALPAISAAIEAGEKVNKPIKLDDAIRILRSEPATTTSSRYGIADVWVCTWRWRSLFKSYSIKLTIDKEDQSVMVLDAGV